MHRAVSASPFAHSHQRWHCWPYNDVPVHAVIGTCGRLIDLTWGREFDHAVHLFSLRPSCVSHSSLALTCSGLSFSRYMCFFALSRCIKILTKSRCHRSYRPILIRQWDSSCSPPLKIGPYRLQGELARDRPLKLGSYRGEEPRGSIPAFSRANEQKKLDSKEQQLFSFFAQGPHEKLNTIATTPL